MAFSDKGWLVLIGFCSILGLTFWTGVNALTVKMLLVWTFIAFGFVTLILHAFGSSVNKLLARFGSSADSPSEFLFSNSK